MKVHYRNIADFCEASDFPMPEHPQLAVVTKENHQGAPQECATNDVTFSTDFYVIAVKQVVSGDLYYGRTKYDFSNGSMMFVAPRQEITPSNVACSSDIVMAMVHEDFLQGHPIRESFKKAGFFSYATNEALHLSPREEKLIRSLMANIQAEYESNPDEFSKELLLSQLDTLLKYANRFYKRQFLNRAEMSAEIVTRFDTAIRTYFETGRMEVSGTPRIEDIALELNMSARYLSDTLKAETGKSAMEHIHLYLLDEAKNLLLEPDSTVSQVAYRLGFDYPQYFSRLFKKKTGLSPKAFREANSLH